MTVSTTDPATERIERELREHFGYQVDLIDHAADLFERDKARLYRADGSTVYGEAEHAERPAALLADVDAMAEGVRRDAERRAKARGRRRGR